jgi:hypothetical protein
VITTEQAAPPPAETEITAPPPTEAGITAPQEAACGSHSAEHAAPGNEPVQHEPRPSRSASDEEDEALLASLDPETAKAIRVMRRLSIEKKSVRELLAEYTHTRSDQDPAEGRRRSWWSRGRT